MAVELKDGNQWLFIAQDMDAKETTFEKSAELSLTTMFNNLAHFDFNYHHLLHSWFFIPQITGYSDQNERYQIFNKHRRKLISKHSDPSGPGSFYPASTGIGSRSNAVWTSAVAFKSNTPIPAHMMDNERQVPAHQYPEHESIEAPLFSRGMCLLFEKSSMNFVSGTASILNAKTVHENDIAGQTRQTIENIHNLLTQNAIEHNLESSSADVKESIKYATIYIKQEGDYPAVKDICCSYFGDIPMSYVKADICRDNLMVEIECISCMNINGGGTDG